MMKKYILNFKNKTELKIFVTIIKENDTPFQKNKIFLPYLLFQAPLVLNFQHFCWKLKKKCIIEGYFVLYKILNT